MWPAHTGASRSAASCTLGRAGHTRDCGVASSAFLLLAKHIQRAGVAGMTSSYSVNIFTRAQHNLGSNLALDGPLAHPLLSEHHPSSLPWVQGRTHKK